MEIINMQPQVSYEAYKPLLDHLNISEEYFIKQWDSNPHVGYPEHPGGSLWTSEGKLLSCIIKKLKPNSILEIGTYKGVSAAHILHAKKPKASFQSVDIQKQDWVVDLDDYFVKNDSLYFLNIAEDVYDFIWIDGCHEYNHVRRELEIIIENKLSKRLLLHDYYVDRPNSKVKQAVDDFNDKYSVKIPVISPESNCGLVYIELL